MKIYLIRHGRQCDKRCNVDVDLSEEGFRQAELAGERMKTWGIQKLYSSDMIRARQTAEVINRYLQVPYEIVPAFREMDFGDMEGLSEPEMKRRYADFFAEEKKETKVLAYPGGESPADVVARYMPALKEVALQPLERVAIATHGAAIKQVFCHILGVNLASWKRWGRGDFENCSINEVMYEPKEDLFSVERFNDHSHLDAYPELLRSAWGVNEN